MAKKTATHDNDVVRQIIIDKLGKKQTFTLTRKAVKHLTATDARELEAGFAERAQDFNQGRDNSTIEVPSKTAVFWKGYEFARKQETAS